MPNEKLGPNYRAVLLWKPLFDEDLRGRYADLTYDQKKRLLCLLQQDLQAVERDPRGRPSGLGSKSHEIEINRRWIQYVHKVARRAVDGASSESDRMAEISKWLNGGIEIEHGASAGVYLVRADPDVIRDAVKRAGRLRRRDPRTIANSITMTILEAGGFEISFDNLQRILRKPAE